MPLVTNTISDNRPNTIFLAVYVPKVTWALRFFILHFPVVHAESGTNAVHSHEYRRRLHAIGGLLGLWLYFTQVPRFQSGMSSAQGIPQYTNVSPILVGLRLQYYEGGRRVYILDKVKPDH